MSADPHAFAPRHLGPSEADQAAMLKTLGFASLEAMVAATVPAGIRRALPVGALPPARDEAGALAALRSLAQANQPARCFIGQGYHGTLMPPVLKRCVLENPGWYTQYTPYQAEISQGRLECLLTFQTLVCELTGLPVANASMLDEATAAAEAMHLCQGAAGDGRDRFLVDAGCHPQVVAVVRTRAEPLGIAVEVAPAAAMKPDARTCGVLLAYPASGGVLADPRAVVEAAHAAGALACLDCDPLALCLLATPGSLGADVAFGSMQRFGVPMGAGGPHAAFFAVRDAHKRLMPGRLVGVSKDRLGQPALRLALQTREQHIRREKATSNICTAQALLANLAALYACWHGPEGLVAIAEQVHAKAARLATGLRAAGMPVASPFFDTLLITVPGRARALWERAQAAGIDLRLLDADHLAVACDETHGDEDLAACAQALGARLPASAPAELPAALRRSGVFCPQPAFHAHRSEQGMVRWLKQLENRDISLVHSMIPLGSCTMKLNAAAEMLPLSWPEWEAHPFAPPARLAGYARLAEDLSRWLCAVTGFAACSLQPNSGAQGEYAGLLAIRAFQRAQGQGHRTACLIPVSAHGTNPASAALAGLSVVPVACRPDGDIDLADLKAKAEAHRADLCCLMVTYPSTHGVFEAGIAEACAIVHAAGGQVYMDGANMNAQVGLTSPGAIGADVCHLNLHKTFAIPHGGGGPGMGPILVARHLAPHLPRHPLATAADAAAGAVSAAPWGSASILTIPWMYLAMMGADGLRRATEVAILNANYIARRLAGAYPVLFTGPNGMVAHECILDLRPFKAAGVEAEDVAKRLMDYGFHAPTLSFPVAGTLMVEPTESEPRDELDRFCDAMLAIREEIRAVAEGRADKRDNPLKMAPHTADEVCGDAWGHPYGRQQAAFPLPWLRGRKVWPAVARVDNAHGDRNLVCTCAGMAGTGAQG